MVGEYVMSQKDIQTDLTKPDSIGMGSYNSDSHNVQRRPTRRRHGGRERRRHAGAASRRTRFRIALMLPKRAEATNLLVPVCFSATHVAYSTLRMEPQYMILGQAAGVAAKMAIDGQGRRAGHRRRGAAEQAQIATRRLRAAASVALAVGPPPSAICHLPSAICHLPSAICHLPSAICHLPSAICPILRHAVAAGAPARGLGRVAIDDAAGGGRLGRARLAGGRRSRLGFMAAPITGYVFAALAIGELIADKLPFIPEPAAAWPARRTDHLRAR